MRHNKRREIFAKPTSTLLVGAPPLVVAPPSVALAAGASGAGATDIAAVASSKVATGGAWSGEWSGDAWTGSSPSDAWLGTGEAAGAAGVLCASDASFDDRALLLGSMLDRSQLLPIYAVRRLCLRRFCALRFRLQKPVSSSFTRTLP